MTVRLTPPLVFVFVSFSKSNSNKYSKPRMVKFYQSVESEALQQTVIRRVFQQIAARPDSFCNYLEGIVPEWGEGIK
jgi:AP-3 complex subunit sigma